MSDALVEAIAAALWKHEARHQATTYSNRTPEAFLDQSEDTRDRWISFAGAAIRAQCALREVPEVTEAMLDAFYTSNPTNHTLPPRHWVRSALTAALAAAPQPEESRP